MSIEPQRPLLTVAILTYNGETYLRRILDSLRLQSFDGEMEILVIDSGSNDSTLAIVRDFPEVRLVEIPNSEFGHGRTRNLAADLARGEFVAFLTHDAIPAHEKWATGLTAPFKISSEIVAVMGKQIPRRGCVPIIKYEIQGLFAGLGSDFGETVYELLPEDEGNEGIISAKAFYSDVNSVARRSFLREVVPYRDVRYAEDQLFGRDLLEAGYKKAYAPAGAVEHSNDLTLEEYGARIFDETVALREIGRDIRPLSARSRVKLTAVGAIRDTARILRDRDYSWRRRLYWLLWNPFFHLRKWKFHNLGARHDLLHAGDVSEHSLEGRRKLAAD